MGFYGYEAMALVLEAIAAGDGRSRRHRARRARHPRTRLGPGALPVDAEGHTTSTAYGRLAVVDGVVDGALV